MGLGPDLAQTNVPALDFTEVAEAHQGAARDQFELFARDFLEVQGFEVVRGPDQGPDAGRDLVVRERRHGPGGVSVYDWLVSCKHKAHSGAAVGAAEDDNFRDRLATHRCQGLIAFYSTLPSSTLATHLNALPPALGLLLYDRERIEAMLLATPAGRALAARYFPTSFRRWVVSSQYAAAPAAPGPAPIHDRLFLRPPHTDLATAVTEAAARDIPLFVVVYDDRHSSRSRLDFNLGYFMGWETTKRLVDEHFVVALGPSADPAFGALVPDDDPLEECRWVVLYQGAHVRSESVYANSGEGFKRIREAIACTTGRAVVARQP